MVMSSLPTSTKTTKTSTPLLLYHSSVPHHITSHHITRESEDSKTERENYEKAAYFSRAHQGLSFSDTEKYADTEGESWTDPEVSP